MYIISACLTGTNCKYSGGNNLTCWVKEFAKTHKHILVCPEVKGGLPIPRLPAEKICGRITDQKGRDVTEYYMAGAVSSWEEAVAKATATDDIIEGAILKANSPSCGRDTIYDGTFTKTLISGSGTFAQLLREKGIKIYTEKEKIDDRL